jgi:excisionase family DNA binding protein
LVDTEKINLSVTWEVIVETFDLVEQGLLRVAEAARFLAVSCSTIYDLMETGRLPYVKLGRSRRIPRQALVDLARRSLVTRET